MVEIHRLLPRARIGVVVFRGKDERIAVEPFTLSSPQLETFLTAIKAENGGEWQEDTLAAVEQMPWRSGAKR